ncbi:amino acid ABC transporter substrate-binding protein (PAAT family) [Sediminihabitans luteus]|uniref:Amino acid ABC transporter substrate-binding protein (PAAT family) n=1 Tax=Sediminihabitans luteus TaxID=1138585 RepID=A0A2M9CYE0_9CELL|nr:glutamate ABC transporter substrate-binding protein [Sediminihabitans luteus]PJJ76863.1 amino acid ABC transporter substrate-binding protein (PAAT family) [Sediminihabitans luteus]GIJ00343.1 ABC transporter substrate-binding protein [Sediminihabitans luteus]
MSRWTARTGTRPPHRTAPRTTAGALAGALAAALLLAGCAAGGTVDPGTAAGSTGTGTDSATGTTKATDAATAAAPSAAPTCDDALESYAPADSLPAPGSMPAGSTMEAIRESGALRVGVSADTLLMGARDPIDGEIEGFDIDVLEDVAEAIFGEPGHLRLKVITSGQRIDVLQDREVDMVARAFSITCDRWDQVAFSAEYLHAGQRLLVPRDSDVTDFGDLAGRRVCAPEGTTTLANLERYPDVVPVPASTHTRCLVMFQRGEVDAITGDDTILAGFVAQDPYAKVVGEPISDEAYGVGMNADDVDLVRFVNGVLAQRVADGAWRASYDEWFGVAGEPAPAPPTPLYGRTP